MEGRQGYGQSLLGLIHVWMGTTWMEQGYISRVGGMSATTIFVTALLTTLTLHCTLADHSPLIQKNDREDDITETFPQLMESSQHIDKRAPYEFGIGKRFPYSSGYGKRAPYEFGIGKRFPYNSEVGKRAPYEFGIGKREPYEFGIGKRAPYEFGIGKRAPYEFGIGKRAPYEFGIGKRSPYDFPFDQHNKRMPYSFGVGKRDLVNPAV